MNLVFYDTETTGTSTFFDQILQFAAIRTDAELNEIDRFEIRCRLLPHIVPSPGAMHVTGVRALQLIDSKLPSHYEMIRSIRAKLLAWSPAIFVGYNSIEFDENLVRQALYKTLHTPYLTNTNGNARSDLMRMVQAGSLFAPDALSIPVADSGNQTFRLDRLAPANGFVHDKAHDALADVQASIFVSRLLKERAPEVWSASIQFSQKNVVVHYISSELVFCLGEFHFGQPYSYLVTALSANADNSSEWYVYDLSVHPESLQDLSDEQLASRLGRSPKPVRRIRVNAAPMIFPAAVAPDSCVGKNLSRETLEGRAKALASDETFCKRLVAMFESQQKEFAPSPHIERQIYDGFFAFADQKLMAMFHESDWSKRLATVSQFQDPRLRAIGLQLMYDERPELLDKDIRDAQTLLAAKRMMGQGDTVAWLTLNDALEEAKQLISTDTGPDPTLLVEHYAYLMIKLGEVTRLLG